MPHPPEFLKPQRRYGIIRQRYDLPEVDERDPDDHEPIPEPWMAEIADEEFRWYSAVEEALIAEFETKSQLAAGTIILHIDGVLQDLSVAVTEQRLAYKLFGRMIGASENTEGVPLGAALWAAANNVRHFREWQAINEPVAPLSLDVPGEVTDNWAFEQYFGEPRTSSDPRDRTRKKLYNARWERGLRQPIQSIYVLQRVLESAHWIDKQVSYEMLNRISREREALRYPPSLDFLLNCVDQAATDLIESVGIHGLEKLAAARAFMQRLSARRRRPGEAEL